MANKNVLITLVLGLILVSLAGCQMLSNDPTVAQATAAQAAAAQAAVEVGSAPAFQDEMILAGWNQLHSMKENIQIADGIVLSGETLAQFLVQQQIPVVWDEQDVCHGTSCSQQFCTLDGDACSYEDGTPGANPIYLNTGIRAQGSGAIERLARELGHEAFHRMQHFGSGMITQIEEYWAFYLDTQLIRADYPEFYGIDPQDPEQLAGWFTTHRMAGYLRLDPYPGVKAQAVEVELDVQPGESLAQE